MDLSPLRFRQLADSERLTQEHYLAIRSDGLTFAACINAAAAEPELVKQFDRLYGATLISRTTPIERMVDEATGKHADDMQAFLRFVWNSVFVLTPAI